MFGIGCQELAKTVDELYKYILCCFITTDYLTVLYLGLIGDTAHTGDVHAQICLSVYSLHFTLTVRERKEAVFKVLY